MSRQTVYRVEHATTGQGPFGADSPPELRDVLSSYLQGRQTGLETEADEDCPGFQAGYHYCAVVALSQLNEWFGPFREQLLALGFVVAQYEPMPGNVLPGRSGHQLVFAKYAATPRRQLPWPSDPNQVGYMVGQELSVSL